MANRYRGEISAVLDGKSYNLCLTLGALAELESAFNSHDMVALATRFENGRLSATEAQLIIAAGLRGAGTSICTDDVAAMKVEGGASGYVGIVAELLQATFGAPPDEQQTRPSSPCTHKIASPREGGAPPPFPGTT